MEKATYLFYFLLLTSLATARYQKQNWQTRMDPEELENLNILKNIRRAVASHQRSKGDSGSQLAEYRYGKCRSYNQRCSFHDPKWDCCQNQSLICTCYWPGNCTCKGRLGW